MTALIVLFWVCFFLIAYSYFGYGIILSLLVFIKRRISGRKFGDAEAGKFMPPVTLVVSAFNEEDFIREKIRNTFELDYPEDLLKIIFVTDGSNDNTPQIVSEYPRIELLHQPQRRGKVAAMNRSLAFVTTPYIIFCDANTLLNRDCIKEIARHYSDPNVGGVAGEKRVLESDATHAAEAGEGLYWKYESYLKKLDAELYSVVGAAGELFSVRKDLFEATREDIIIEDFVQSLKICMKGYVIRYEPNAYASETSSQTMKDEQKRKIRICAGAFQAMGELKGLFNPFKYPVLSFQFISHRILRWTLCPLSLVLLLPVNLAIVASGGPSLYIYMFAAQLFFYFLAITGWIFANKDIKVKALYVPYYFLFMNISVFMGFRRFLQKKQSVLWEKAARQKLA